MLTLYIGCSLTQAPEEFKKRVADLKESLKADYTVLEFVGLTAGTAKEVYEWDIHECVEKCDVFIALCDYPSIGLGYELGVAIEKRNIPTLALAHADAKITRLIQGIERPTYEFTHYSDFSEIPELIKKFLLKVPSAKLQ